MLQVQLHNFLAYVVHPHELQWVKKTFGYAVPVQITNACLRSGYAVAEAPENVCSVGAYLCPRSSVGPVV
jgi:hypothetical protein